MPRPEQGVEFKISRQELEHLYWEKGMSAAAIARMLGVSRFAVLKRMKAWGIPRRPKKMYEAPDRGVLEELAREHTDQEIAEKLGVPKWVVICWRRSYGILKMKRGKPGLSKRDLKVERWIEQYIAPRLDLLLSRAEMADGSRETLREASIQISREYLRSYRRSCRRAFSEFVADSALLVACDKYSCGFKFGASPKARIVRMIREVTGIGPDIDPEKRVDAQCRILGRAGIAVPEIARRTAKQILRMVPWSRDPRVLSAAAIMVACEMVGYKLTLSKLAQCLNLTDPTLRSGVRYIEQTVGWRSQAPGASHQGL